MHILIAPNAFKNSLGAAAVAEAIAEGLLQSNLECTTECFPVGDGGDGTGVLLSSKLNAAIISVEVLDPLRRRIACSYGLTGNDSTAIIEMSAASGLRLLNREEYDPLHASSFGTGQLIVDALQKKARNIIIAIGGSATVDAGTGILQALGIRFLDANDKELFDLPDKLYQLKRIDTTSLNPFIKTATITVLCDVENTLLGLNGAAAVFGPQKGARPSDVLKLDAALAHFSEVVYKQTGKDMVSLKHGGAAGGIAAALHCLLGAALVNGIDYFLGRTNFNSALEKANLVITGEGSIDLQTLQGKAPWGVAKRAKEKNIPVIGMAGMVPKINEPKLNEYFDRLLSINKEPFDISSAIKNTRENLVSTSKKLGDQLALPKLS